MRPSQTIEIPADGHGDYDWVSQKSTEMEL